MPLRPRLLGQQRPGEHIGFDIDHDDVLAGGDRCAGMGDAGRRTAGRLDDDLDLGIGAGLGARRDKRVRAIRAASQPTVRQALPRPLGIEIGDDRDLQPGHRRHLVQEHRAELAGADQPTRTGSPGGGALLQQAIEVHGLFRRPPCSSRRGRNSNSASSATGSIGVKSRCAIHSGRVGVRM